MIVETRPSPLRLAAAFPTKVGVRMWLGCLVVCSAAIRSIAAGSVRTPTYFPDEYIYSALSRSIAASGRPLVRGEPAHFPALLEPLLAAPLWLVGSIATGYRLVQCENALFMSLAAIPVYLLARRLGLGSRYAFASAAFALALPELGFSALVLSDPLAYPLVLGALYAGVVALQAPSRRSQLSFVGLVGLATFARVEYVVLAVAFVIAAVLLDGRRAARLQRLPLVLFGGVAIGVVALGPSRVLGFYSAVVRLHLDGSFVRWAALDLLFLALAGGVAIVPGAVVGLFRGGDRGARAFGALVVPFALAVMVETALYAGNGSDRFKERYLFMLLPLCRSRSGSICGVVGPAAWPSRSSPPRSWPGRPCCRSRATSGETGSTTHRFFGATSSSSGTSARSPPHSSSPRSRPSARVLRSGRPGRGRSPGLPSRGPWRWLSPSRSAPTGSSGQ